MRRLPSSKRSTSRPAIPLRSSRSRSAARPKGRCRTFPRRCPTPAYKLGDSVATREAYGTALAALGAIDRRVVALDADVKNSTFSERFEKVHAGPLLPDVHRRAGDGRRVRWASPRAARFRFRRASRRSSSARATSSAWPASRTSTSSWPARTPACRSARTARRRWRSKTSRCSAACRIARSSIRPTR